MGQANFAEAFHIIKLHDILLNLPNIIFRYKTIIFVILARIPCFLINNTRLFMQQIV